MREGVDALSGDELGERVRRSGALEYPRADRRGEDRLDHEPAPDLRHHDRNVAHGATVSAGILRHGGAQHALLGQHGPQRKPIRLRRAEALAARVEIVMVVQQARDQLAEHLLGFSLGERHRTLLDRAEYGADLVILAGSF